MSTDQIKQEIKDLFAKYGSGDYMPTAAEKVVIDAQLDEIFRVYNEAPADGEFAGVLRDEGAEFVLLDFKRRLQGVRMTRDQALALSEALLAWADRY